MTPKQRVLCRHCGPKTRGEIHMDSEGPICYDCYKDIRSTGQPHGYYGIREEFRGLPKPCHICGPYEPRKAVATCPHCKRPGCKAHLTATGTCYDCWLKLHPEATVAKLSL